MGTGSSDLVRTVTAEKYVRPAIQAGKTHFSVAVRDVMKDLLVKGFPAGNYPQVCTAIRAGKFLKENGLEIESVDGPPSGLSTTVVFHYKVAKNHAQPRLQSFSSGSSAPVADDLQRPIETSDERAERLTEKLRGLLKEELAEYGGAEAFIRWIRSEDESEVDR